MERKDELNFVKKFSDQMIIEIENNQHKGNVFNYSGLNEMITELEYHKAKMLIAIRSKNKIAIKEYIADCANILMAIGNNFNVYDSETKRNDFISVISENPILLVKNNSNHVNIKIGE